MNEMRMVKFETLIKDIEEKLRHRLFKKTKSFYRFNKTNLPLALIYDVARMNEYAAIIYQNTGYLVEQEWNNKYFSIADETDNRVKMNAAKEFTRIVRNDADQKYGHKFIFWALMVLAVDDRNKEEYLSTVCDFAKMLNIPDNEVLEIANIVKLVFQDKTARKVTLPTVKATFDEVLKKYEPNKF